MPKYSLHYPLLGVQRSMPYCQQGRFTTPDAKNVRPLSTALEKRARGGSRPGVCKEDETLLGSGAPVRGIWECDYIDTSTKGMLIDSFDGSSLSTAWTAAAAFTALPSVTNGMAYAASTTATAKTAGRALPSDMDSTAAYTLRLFIVPTKGTFDGIYSLFLRMNNSSQNILQDGIWVQLQLSGSAYSGTLYGVNAAIATSHALSSGTLTEKPGWLEVTYTPSTDLTVVKWQGVQLISQDMTADIGAGAGTHIGFGVQNNSSGGVYQAQADHFRMNYTTSSSTQKPLNVLAAVSNGALYKRLTGEAFSAVSSSLTLASDRPLIAQQRTQKLYIADNKVKASGITGVVQNTYLAVSTIALTNGVVTITTSTDHHAVVGMKVQISGGIVALHGINYTVDGVFTITAVNAGAKTFTYTKLNPTTPGVVKVTSGSANITGIGTNFDPVIAANDIVQINGENKTILSRAGAADTAAVATTTFGSDADGQILYLDLPATSVTGTRAIIVGNIFAVNSGEYSDWTALSLSTYDDVVRMGASSGGLPEDQVIAGTYGIAEIATTKLYLTRSAVNDLHPTSSEGYGTVTYSVGRMPKIYDPSAGTLTAWATETETFNAADISSIARTDNLVTVTMVQPHLLAVGDSVTIASLVQNSLFNGTFPVASVTGLAFTYELVGEDVVTQVAQSKVIKASLTSNVVTITTRAAHGLSVGMNATVALNPANATFDSTWYVASTPTATTFTFAKTASDVTEFRTKGTVSAVVGTATQVGSSKGTIPFGCTMITLFRDSLIMAGDPSNPHMLFASRSGNPLDWRFSGDANDLNRAYSGQETPMAGLLGKTITAICAWTDDYMVIGCKDSVWVQTGSIAAGGSIDPLSRTVGIVSPQAWCTTPTGHFIFLSNDGLYGTPNVATTPQPISKLKMPLELQNINTDNYTVLMKYDLRAGGIHIFLTPVTAQTGFIHFFFDWENKGFWPQTFQSSHEPHSIFVYNSLDPFDNGILLGGRDGYVRRFRDVCENDDGSDIANYVIIGPFRPFDDFTDCLVLDFIGSTGLLSGDVTWNWYQGDTPESCYSASSFATGTWVAGLNTLEHVRMRGGAVMLKLTGPTTRAWAYESGAADIINAGRHRP